MNEICLLHQKSDCVGVGALVGGVPCWLVPDCQQCVLRLVNGGQNTLRTPPTAHQSNSHFMSDQSWLDSKWTDPIYALKMPSRGFRNGATSYFNFPDIGIIQRCANKILLPHSVDDHCGQMLKAPPLKCSVLHLSVLNSKTEVCSNGGVKKKFDKLTLQNRPDKCKIS